MKTLRERLARIARRFFRGAREVGLSYVAIPDAPTDAAIEEIIIVLKTGRPGIAAVARAVYEKIVEIEGRAVGP